VRDQPQKPDLKLVSETGLKLALRHRFESWSLKPVWKPVLKTGLKPVYETGLETSILSRLKNGS
jgi:hypothetical protein